MAFLRFADGENLRPEANQIRKLSENSISSDTQNVYSLLPLTVITSGNFPSSCHGVPAHFRKNMEGGISVLLQMTAQGQQQATAERGESLGAGTKKGSAQILLAVCSEAKQQFCFQWVRMVLSWLPVHAGTFNYRRSTKEPIMFQIKLPLLFLPFNVLTNKSIT